MIVDTRDAKRKSLQDDYHHISQVIVAYQFEWSIDDEIDYTNLLNEIGRDINELERHETKSRKIR